MYTRTCVCILYFRATYMGASLQLGALAEGVDLDLVAKRTIGFSGASLANLMNEAAIVAARNEKTEIGYEEIDYAIDRQTVGMVKETGTSFPNRQLLVAYHEAGHAVMGALAASVLALSGVHVRLVRLALAVVALPRVAHRADPEVGDRRLRAAEEHRERVLPAEELGKDLLRLPAREAAATHPGRREALPAELIVRGALLLVREHLVRLRDLLEILLGELLPVRILVRVCRARRDAMVVRHYTE